MGIAAFYRGDPEHTPKPNRKTKLGSNVILTWNDRLLLEKRMDSDVWGLPGGGVKKQETGRKALSRELWEELGVRFPEKRFCKFQVYGEPGRVAAYRDGSVWRMVIVVYGLNLSEEIPFKISRESRELRFFTREEIKNISIAVTHEDIVEDWFVSGKYAQMTDDYSE